MENPLDQRLFSRYRKAALVYQSFFMLCEVSSALAARGIGMLLGSPVGGVLKDRFQSYTDCLLTGSLILLGTGIIIVPFCPNLPTLWLAFVVAGMGYNGGQAINFAYVVTLWGAKAPRPLNICTATEGIGKILSPAIAIPFLMKTVSRQEQLSYIMSDNDISNSTFNNLTGPHIYTGSVYKVYIIVGTLILAGALGFSILLYWLKPSQDIFDHNVKTIAENHMPLTKGEDTKTVIKIFCLLVFFLYFFLLDMVTDAMTFYLYSIAVKGPLGFGSDEASNLNIASQVVGLISCITPVLILACISIQYFTNILLIMASLSGIIMSLYGLQSNVLLWTTSLIFTYLSSPSYSCRFAYANEFVTITGLVSGFFEIGKSVGFFVSAWLTAYLLENYGAGAALWEITAATLCQAGIVLAVRFITIKKENNIKDIGDERRPLFRNPEE